MLVTLGNNTTISANASATFTYSPSSVQQVFVRLEDADWELASITVQIGSVTICNGVNAYGLKSLTQLQSDVTVSIGGTESFVLLNFGSHQCLQRDNLYVTVQAGAGELSAVDVSAIVDEPGDLPLRITEYSDNTFTSPANLLGVCYDSAFNAIEEDTSNCEIRTAVSSSAPSFVSSASYYRAMSIGKDSAGYFGVLNKHGVPLDTTYNYQSSATADRIITVEQMPSSQSARQQSEANAKITESQRSV